MPHHRFRFFATMAFALAGCANEKPNPHTESVQSLTRRSVDAVALTKAATAHLTALHPNAEYAATPVDANLVRLTQVHRGVPIVGAASAVRTDDAGAVRWVRDRTIDVTGIATVPSLSLAAAMNTARGVAKLPTAHDGNADLVIWAPPNQKPRLAWRVDFAAGPGAVAPRLVVAADDGSLLESYDLTLHAARGWAFERNPFLGPAKEVSLEHLPAGAKTLADESFDIRTCVDDATCTEFASCEGSGFWLNLCALEPKAVADASGDFLAYTQPPDSTVVDDAFAEVQLYHHLSRARAWFGGFGLTKLDATPMMVVANYRDDAHLCDGPTADGPIGKHYNNAFYAPKGLLGHNTEPTLAFGNGSIVDFAWDGDVVVHELGHAVMHAVGDLGRYVRDEYGMDPTPWAMHEGLADYFAIAFSGDPLLGEWIGASEGFAPVRDLSENRKCNYTNGDDPWPLGLPHHEGVAIAAALWDIRTGLAEADRPKMDRAMFRVISALDEFDTFITTAKLIESELNAELGATAATAAKNLLDERDISDCPRAVELIPSSWTGNGGEYHWIVSPAAPVGGVAPSRTQYTFQLAQAATALTFAVGGSCSSASVAWLKAGGEPIRWTWNGTSGTNDAIKAESKIKPGTNTMTHTFVGNFQPGTYHYQIGNTDNRLCEQGPETFSEGDGDGVQKGFAIGTEWPGGREGGERDGQCNLADVRHDRDCYDNRCSSLPNDPDCDGVCTEEVRDTDPECSDDPGPERLEGYGVTASADYATLALEEGETCPVEEEEDEGGCRTARGAPSALPLFGLALMLAGWRRRRGRAR